MRSLLLAWILLLGPTVSAVPLASAADAPRTLVFHVKGMTCVLCGKAIDRSLRRVDGVQNVLIDAKTERVTVLATSTIDPKKVDAAIKAVGNYETELLPPR